MIKPRGEHDGDQESAPNPKELSIRDTLHVSRICFRLGKSMIKSFRCKVTQKLYEGEPSRKFRGIRRQAELRLDRLDQAVTLQDLAAFRGNRLESLHGNRRGQHSIRINDQWRICFVWHEDGPHDVEIVDYH